jgi:hypothetical protein
VTKRKKKKRNETKKKKKEENNSHTKPPSTQFVKDRKETIETDWMLSRQTLSFHLLVLF